MNNFNDDDDDLSKFVEENEKVKPIDIGGPAQPRAPQDDETQGPGPLADFGQMEKRETEPEAGPQDSQQKPETPDEPAPPAQPERELDAPNYIKKGEYVDLTEKVAHLQNIELGAGWDQVSLEGESVDVDLSIFLCDKTGQTRVDEDFIFYNNDKACNGAVRLLGDSRTGAGQGDDEVIFIDLNGVPFDILNIVCVLSIYDPETKGHHFGMVKNVYLRLVNKDEGEELFRYKLAPEDCQGGNAIMAGSLIREGAKWVFEASADGTNGGLAKFATDYGIIVKELQSTAETDI